MIDMINMIRCRSEHVASYSTVVLAALDLILLILLIM